jgi:geranylgeranyl transferase type-2 subunit alpha
MLAKSSPEFEMLKNALWVDSSDQSLWYYYQFLMTSIVDLAAKEQIVLQLTPTDRLNYLAYQLTELRELLDGADNPKWIYAILTEYTTAMWGIKGQPPPEVKQEVKAWLEELRRLDPLRAGRWDDMEAILCSE